MQPDGERRRRNRDRVMAIAFRLFRDQGYDETTVDEIAAAAGVSPRTFYRYFATKDAVLSRRGAAACDEVVQRVSTSPSVRELLEAFVDVIEEAMEEDDFGTFVQLLRDHPGLADHAPMWRQRWADRIAAGLAARRADDGGPSLADRVTSTITVQVVSLALDVWLHGRAEQELRSLAREVLRLTNDRLAGSPGDCDV